jgi:small subunit ribosomal protein S6
LETVADKKLYEGMFLVDSAEAATDWDGVLGTIKKILERAKAQIVSIRKWDDRRLAYDIRGVSRGTYILCYFRADGEKIQDIEKSVQLSERVMRVLILNAEHMTAEDIEKDTPATRAEKEVRETASVQTSAKQPDERREAPQPKESQDSDARDEDAGSDEAAEGQEETEGGEGADDSQKPQSETEAVD